MSASLRTIFCGLALLVILLTSGCSGNDPDQQARPNILLILTDDLGNNDIASWGDGTAPTPTLDELSRQSVRFRLHFTDSTCSPSRAALLTGQHPVSVGFQTNGLGLSSDLRTLPKSLKALGYRTAHIGKWHVGEALEYPEINPGAQGFDYWLGMLNHFVLRGPGAEGQIIRSAPTYLDPWLQENGGQPQQFRGYLDDILTEKAIELMSEGNQPWFINLWLFAPHTPYQPSPRFADQFPNTADGQFQSILKHIDFNVERLLESLERKGLSENTIVIFASDNGGPNLARDNNFPLLGKKTNYLDGGVRSPMLLRWPHHYENREVPAPSHITDIFPTLIALAGGTPPAGIMGRDLRPLMNGQTQDAPSAFYWMADGGLGNMTYGGQQLEHALFFYRDLFGTYTKGLAKGAIATPSAEPRTEHAFPEAADADVLITAFERQVRTPPFTWKPSTAAYAGQLSGLDFQRAPVLGGYSLGLSLQHPAAHPVQQTLLEQQGVWRIDWLPDQRLRVVIGNEEQFSTPIDPLKQTCNKLVVSTQIEPARTHPFPGPASSRLLLYWNGKVVLDSPTVLTRPRSATPLKNPTWIGNSADGQSPLLNQHLAKPVIVNKFLLPQQEGYDLSDMQAELCVEGPAGG